MTLGDVFQLLAPELILLLGAGVVLLVGAPRGGRTGGLVSSLAFITLLAALVVSIRQGVPQDGQVVLGLWITSLSYYTRCITLGTGLLIVLVNWVQSERADRGEWMAMILFSLLGILLTASANDLLLLFFAIELVSVPTYVLVALSRSDSRAPEAAVKYFFLGALAAALLAYGLSFLYGAAGTTTIYSFTKAAAVSNLSFAESAGSAALIGLLLVFAGLAFKIAAFPLHGYVADVYEGAASPVTGMLGFAPKMAGMVALVKLLAAFNWELPTTFMWLIWLVAAATMTAGNVLALLQKNVKRMLAYSSVAHSGYMLIGLLVGPVAGSGPMHDGVAAMLFYIAVYGVMNLGAFAVLGMLRSGDRDAETLEELGGLAKRAPAAAFALAVCVLSLMGFPPTAGFLGKLFVFSSAFSVETGHAFHGPLIALAIVGVINSAIGAAYYLRIVAAAYMGNEAGELKSMGGGPVALGAALCSMTMLALFAWPAALSDQSRAATVILQRTVRQSPQRVAAAPAVPATANLQP